MSNKIKYNIGMLILITWLFGYTGVKFYYKDANKELQTTENSDFNLVVDYDLTLEEAIKAGCYNDVDSKYITEANFPKTKEESGKRKVCFNLYRFDKRMMSEEVVEEMSRDGYRPAGLRELLALGQRKLKLQKDLPIIALGAVSVKDQNNVSLWIDSLLLASDDLGWIKGCHFLAIKE